MTTSKMISGIAMMMSAGGCGARPASAGASVAVTSSAIPSRIIGGMTCSPHTGATISTAPSRANSRAPIQAYWVSQSNASRLP